jgi:nucleoside-diphosphate-sugar epimerase
MRELAIRGLEVRAVSRREEQAPDGVLWRAADVATAAGAAAACEEASVVYHCVQPPYDRWAEQLPPVNNAVSDAVAREAAKLVVADNLYMYGPIAGPISETSSQQPSSSKGRLRKELADALLSEHETGRIRVTIGRASDYYGPGGSNSIAGETLFGAAVAGKRVRWPASADQPRSFSYLPDLARALVTLGESDSADGRTWIVPSASITARALVELIERELDRPVKLVVTSKLAMRLAGLAIRPARSSPTSGTSSRRRSSPTDPRTNRPSARSARPGTNERCRKRSRGFAQRGDVRLAASPEALDGQAAAEPLVEVLNEAPWLHRAISSRTGFCSHEAFAGRVDRG